MIYGNLAIVPRDNLGSFLPCGFKENCSALKITGTAWLHKISHRLLSDHRNELQAVS